jgi:hypothetical protein
MVVATVLDELLHIEPVTVSSLSVALDYDCGPDGNLVGVGTYGSPCTALAEQVPALVQGDLDLTQPFDLLGRDLLAGVRSLERVLLFGQVSDPLHDLAVVHSPPPGSSLTE